MILFEAPTIFTTFNVLLSLLTFVILVGGSVIILLARRKDETTGIQIKRADANEGLLKVREKELDDCSKKCSRCQEELEEVTAELRTQMAINVDQLASWWQNRDTDIAERDNLRQQVKVLKIRLGEPI